MNNFIEYFLRMELFVIWYIKERLGQESSKKMVLNLGVKRCLAGRCLSIKAALSRLPKYAAVFFWGIAASLLAHEVMAQEYDYNDLPVLDPKPDFNGVDVGSGGYSTASPLTFSAPGAGHLNVSYMFNGKQESFSLNVFLEDTTYAPRNYASASERHLRVSVGGIDKLFTCVNLGECEQDVHLDGSRLNRVTEKNYVFTDKHGARYTFYPYAEDNSLINCDGEENDDGCNEAGYHAFAYVSTIEYPSGEKLSYLPSTGVTTISGEKFQVNTIQSNLGYKLVIESSRGTSYTPLSDANLNWWHYRQIGRNGSTETKMSLYRGTSRINTLTTQRDISSFEPGATRHLEHSDDLGRKYTVIFRHGRVKRCFLDSPMVSSNFAWSSFFQDTIDSTILLPEYEKSPGGVVTYIKHHMVDPSSWLFAEALGVGTSIPVSTITRGGYVWAYDNVADSKTITGPNLETRTAEFSWIHDDYSYGPAQCPAGFIETRVTSYTDAIDRRTDYDYTDASRGGQLDTAMLPEQNGYDYDYDNRGNLTQITQLAKPGNANRVIFQAYYPVTCNNPKICNKPSWVKDAKGNRTDYTYNPTHGGVVTVSRPAVSSGVRPTTTYSYTPTNTGNGTIWRQTGSSLCTTSTACAGTRDELQTVTAYWSNTFLPETVTQKAGDDSVSATQSYQYNSAGLVTVAEDALGQSSHYFYDAVGRKTGEISEDPDGTGTLLRLAKRISYNNDDQPTLLETGTVTGSSKAALDAMRVMNYVDIDYDDLGRKERETKVASGKTYAITQYSFDAWNRPVCTAVRMNFNSLPADACSVGTPGEYGYDRITKNEYDDAGQLKNVYRAYGTALQQVYSSFIYSDNGKKTFVIDANGNSTKYEYDEYDRLEFTKFPSKAKGEGHHSETDYEQYGYDLNDNRTTLRRRDGASLVYGYDSLDRMEYKLVPNRTGLSTNHSQNIYYGYDTRGLALYSRFGSHSGQGITQTYNALGHMLTSTSNMDGVSRKLTHGYHANGVRKSVRHPDGHTFIYNHDSLNRLNTVTHSGAGILADYGYDSKGDLLSLRGGVRSYYNFEASGRLVSMGHSIHSNGVTTTGGYTYQYNPASQITSIRISDVQYAPLSTQQNKSYVSNGLNQYTGVGGVTYGYDDNANLTSDGETIYTYDQENRLVKATDMSGALKAELWYDPLGKLYKMQSPTAITHFLYDGDELIAEYSGTSTTVNERYIHGISVDDPVAWFHGSAVTISNSRHLRANHQGTIVSVANRAGAKIYLPRYDNWGNPEATQPVRFGYTGQVWIEELGLWHYKARMYSPVLGRFLQTDPVGYEDQMNLYAYVHNDPMNNTDPSGMICIPCVGAVVGGVAGAIVYAATTDNMTVGGMASAVGSGAVVGALTSVGAGAIAASGMSATATGASIVGAGTVVGAAGEAANQMATSGGSITNVKAVAVAGVANGVGALTGGAASKPIAAGISKAISTPASKGTGVPIKSLSGKMFPPAGSSPGKVISASEGAVTAGAESAGGVTASATAIAATCTDQGSCN